MEGCESLWATEVVPSTEVAVHADESPEMKPEKLGENADEEPVDPKNGDIYDYDSDEAEAEYIRQMEESGGFDIDDFSESYDGIGIVVPFKSYWEYPDYLQSINELSKMAIQIYNKENGTNYHDVEVEKVNLQLVKGFFYYITFKASDGDVKAFQTLGYADFPNKHGYRMREVEFVRLKGTI